MNVQAYKYVVLNVIGLALFMAAWVVGWIPGVMASDVSYLTTFIICGVIVAVGLVAFEQNKLSLWIGGTLPLLGLTGTVVGMIISTSEISLTGGVERSVEEAGIMLGGIATSFGTTLFGIVGFLWVKINHLVVNEDFEL